MRDGLGGMLTNWETIKLSIAKLNELETQEREGNFAGLPKKEAALCKKQKERLEKYLGGVKKHEACAGHRCYCGPTRRDECCSRM